MADTKKTLPEYWNEIDTTKEPSKCSDGWYYPLTERAWDVRFNYAVERIGKYVEELGMSLSTQRVHLHTQRALERYKDVVMVRISDGHREPLRTPKWFAKRHDIRVAHLRVFLYKVRNKDSRTRTIAGWTTEEIFNEMTF